MVHCAPQAQGCQRDKKQDEADIDGSGLAREGAEPDTDEPDANKPSCSVACVMTRLAIVGGTSPDCRESEREDY